MRVVLLGAPGSGKGTQAAALSRLLGIPAISTGEIFRDHIRRQTVIGAKVAALVEAGDYVPDELTDQLVQSRLREPDTRNGFLLDGYPRTVDQTATLDLMLRSPLTVAVQIVVPVAHAIARIRARAIIEGRKDDSDEAISRRLEVYDEMSGPVVARYREQGLLIDVDGSAAPDRVTTSILTRLGR